MRLDVEELEALLDWYIQKDEILNVFDAYAARAYLDDLCSA